MNSWEEFLYWEHKSRQAIDFKVIYVDISGDLIAGLMLSQIVYWHLPNKDGQSKLKVKHDNKEWLARSDSEWMEEVRITKAQARRARQILSDKNIIEEHVYKFNGIPTTHIRLNQDVLMKLIHEIYSIETKSSFVIQDKSICVPAQVHLCSSTSPFVFHDKSITESTTKTTSEITSEIEDNPANAGICLDGKDISKQKKSKSAFEEKKSSWVQLLWNTMPKDRLPNSKKLVLTKLNNLEDQDSKKIKCDEEVIEKIKKAIEIYDEHHWSKMPEEERKFIPLLNNFIGKNYWLPSLEDIERRAKQLGSKNRSNARQTFDSNLKSFTDKLKAEEKQYLAEIEQQKMIGDGYDT